MNKQKIREKMKSLRAALSASEVEILSKRIYDNFFSLDVFDKEKFFVYLSFENEVKTDEIILELEKRKKQIFVPKIYGKVMKSVKINTKTTFLSNNFGIKEPIGEPSDTNNFVAIMPCLAVDKQGKRVGFGGGYYDKFLANKNALKIVLCYDFQVVDKIDSEPFDIPVDYIVTDKRIIKTR